VGSPKAARNRRSATVFLMAFVTIALMVAFLVTSLIPGLVLRQQQRAELSRLGKELSKIKGQNAQLKDDISRLADPAYVEMLARSRYNMARKGERLYRIIDVPGRETTPTAARAPESWLTRTWRWLASTPSKLAF
jgi:cell division protein FtsB